MSPKDPFKKSAQTLGLKTPRSRPTVDSLWSRFIKSPQDAALTLLIGSLCIFCFYHVLRWGVLDATFRGYSHADCQSDGACWPFITSRWGQFIYGFYPVGERWRIHLAGIWVLGLGGLYFSTWRPLWKTGLTILSFPLLALLLRGGFLGLSSVETSAWGGLFLTLVMGLSGAMASIPIGILLACGRRSRLPVVRIVATTCIEVVRGVPLITVLFLASVMLPLILPPDTQWDKLWRALIGIILFSGAYMAEVIRGGLDAIPKGQYEAAAALGLSSFETLLLVILPQALRKVVPAIVNTIIGLFKDTTLVLIIGMFDLLGMVQAASTDPSWLGTATEGYLFAGAMYWALCFGLSIMSRHLEEKPHHH